MKFNGKTVTENTYSSIMGFFFMYIFLFLLSSVSLSFFDNLLKSNPYFSSQQSKALEQEKGSTVEVLQPSSDSQQIQRAKSNLHSK